MLVFREWWCLRRAWTDYPTWAAIDYTDAQIAPLPDYYPFDFRELAKAVLASNPDTRPALHDVVERLRAMRQMLTLVPAKSVLSHMRCILSDATVTDFTLGAIVGGGCNGFVVLAQCTVRSSLLSRTISPTPCPLLLLARG